MSCIVYIVSSTTHATCPLELTAYKYRLWKVSSATQKLSCKTNYKTPFFSRIEIKHTNKGQRVPK